MRARLVTFVVVSAAGFALGGNPWAVQIGWGLSYLAGVVLATMITFAGAILALNLAVIMAWRSLRLHEEHPVRLMSRLWSHLTRPGGTFHEWVTLVNRQLSHIEGMALWVLAITAATPKLGVQVCAITALLVLAEPVLDLVGGAILHKFPNLRDPERTLADDAFSAGEIHWARRPLIHLITFAGLFFVARLSPEQTGVAGPLFLALGGSALIRLAIWLVDASRSKKHIAARSKRYASAREHLARFASLDTPVLALGPVALAVLYGVFGARENATPSGAPSGAGMMDSWAERSDSCLADPGLAPTSVDLSLTLVGDLHRHHTGGERFAGQLGIAKALVPFAHGPVELDILSPVTLPSFAALEEQEQNETKTHQGWAYLGDFTDLGCASELDRALAGLGLLDMGHARGVAMGGHDGRFGGTFDWSPHADEACGEALRKSTADELVLGEFSKGVGSVDGKLARVSARSSWLRGLPTGDALVGVTPLGRTLHAGSKRPVLGVFLDTNDDIDFDPGLPRDHGTLSEEQLAAATAMLEDLDTSARALLIIFTHHPVAHLSKPARERLGAWIARRERDEPRILGVISGHEHEAGEHVGACIGDRSLDNILIGSATYAPQEIARLEVGPDRYGVATLSVTTIPAVSRTGMTCVENEQAPTSFACQQRMSELSRHPECRALFEREDGRRGAECQQLEADVPLLERLSRLGDSPSPEQLRAAENIRAEHLFACLCRDERCGSNEDTDLLDPTVTDKLLTTLGDSSKQARDELTCMSWAAASMAKHANAGMEMADALRCAFDDRSAAPARRILTKLEARACF